MIKSIRTLRGVILVAFMTLALSMLSALPVTATEPSGPPSPPTFYDACGTSMDEVWNTGFQDYDYVAYFDGVRQGMTPDTPYSTGGATNVQVDAINGYTSQVAQSWTQVYDTTAPCGVPAANQYSAAVTGACDPVRDITPVSATLLNVLDVYREYLPVVYVQATRISDGFYPLAGDEPMLRILDGETKTMTVSAYGGGLPSGRWSVEFFTNVYYKPSSKLGAAPLTVTSCNPSHNGSGGASKATGKLRLKLKPTACAAVARGDARKTSTGMMFKYRLIQVFKHGKPGKKIRNFSVKSGKTKVVRMPGVPGAKFILRVRLGSGWKKIAKPVVVPTSRRC